MLSQKRFVVNTRKVNLTKVASVFKRLALTCLDFLY